ncbi:MAG: glycerol acyltransferase [Planctomycetaceae bacterium]|nr:glycerol acyltransferase [Planctomycetaceae bacterium]
MNRQPYCSPPASWPAKLAPWWIRLSRGYRHRQLIGKQRIVDISPDNIAVVQSALTSGNGVLITPNHSAHYDAPALYAAFDEIRQPLYIMTAWQVFGLATKFERWAMQRLGCFSIDREGTDRQAFKQAVEVVQNEPHPLVIFPEGDIYHTTDYVTPFRDGAAAIALSAAKRSERPISIVPCGIKFWYVDDPREQLLEAMQRIEERLYLRVDPDSPLPDRIHRLAEAALALKELDYLGYTCSGKLRDRIRGLLETVVSRLERKHKITKTGGTPPERVKTLRQAIIRCLEDEESPPGESNGEARHLRCDMEDLFFAMQLYSYRGDYLVTNPSIERLAETVDKFEEDVLGLDYPSVRGNRRVAIRFAEAIELQPGKSKQNAAELTEIMQSRVQATIDNSNALGSRFARPTARD